MPIINPGSLDALGFFPFQINPHYYNQPVLGFNGETRDQRLSEFVQLNPDKKIVGLPEGTALLKKDDKLKLVGNEAWLFEWKGFVMNKTTLKPSQDLNFLL